MARTVIVGVLLAALMLTSPTARAEENFDRGVQDFNQGNYHGAIQCLDEACRVDRKNPTAFYYKALAYQRLGKSNEARDLYEAVANLFPGTREAVLAASYLRNSTMALPAQPLARRGPTSAGHATPGLSRNVTTYQTRVRQIRSGDDILPEETSVPFTRNSSGHMFVNAEVNGRTIKVMFDTGAEVCLFGKNHLQSIGVTPQLVGPEVEVGGGGRDPAKNAADDNRSESRRDYAPPERVGGRSI